MKIVSPIKSSLLLIAAVIFAGCSSTTVVNRTDYATSPVTKPVVVYVRDFGLLAENIQKGNSVLSVLPGRGPLRAHLLGQSGDPEKLARKLVDLMADSLVKDLTKAGFIVQKLPVDAPLPLNGWLVRGVFTEVQEGNRLQRAIIGFGSGKTDLQVITGIDNLSKGVPQPLYQMESDSNSGNAPGAVATIIISPYTVPVRFVMSGQDLEKSVKHTASKITEEINQRILASK
jgi:hypothetical protein